jgi:hypothetical protein
LVVRGALAVAAMTALATSQAKADPIDPIINLLNLTGSKPTQNLSAIEMDPTSSQTSPMG